MTWADYLNRYAGSETGREVAAKIGVTESNVSRWRKGGQTPDVKYVAAFARAYNRPVLEAFLAAGFLTEEEAKARPRLAPDPEQLSNEELVRVLLSRLNLGGEEHERSAPTNAIQISSRMNRSLQVDLDHPVKYDDPEDTESALRDNYPPPVDDYAPAAKHGVIEESGEFNT